MQLVIREEPTCLIYTWNAYYYTAGCTLKKVQPLHLLYATIMLNPNKLWMGERRREWASRDGHRLIYRTSSDAAVYEVVPKRRRIASYLEIC